MSATRLLVLAFVRVHGRAHGYLIGQELLAWNADKWANTKTGSIYHALRQLAKEGLLREFGIGGTDSSSPRTEYEISPSGEAEFHRLMEQALTVPEARPDMLCAGLVLMSALPRQSVLDLLRERLAVLARQMDSVERAGKSVDWTGENARPAHVQALIDFWVHQAATSHAFIEDLTLRIEGGAYVFADDDPSVFGTPGSRAARTPAL